MNNINLTISIVVYQPDLNILATTLKQLHQSIFLSKNTRAHLYIIDNSINKEWYEKIKVCLEKNFPLTESIKAEVIASAANIGYGAANNLVIPKIDSDYHLVMNPDVFVAPDTITEAINYMQQHTAVGLLTPAVYGEDGQRHYLCKKNPTLLDMFLRSAAPGFIRKLFAQHMKAYEMRDHNYDNVIEKIAFPTGCFMFFRTNILKKANGFDPQFFMYYEDADIGRRIAASAQINYVPQVKVIHKWARGTHHNARLKWVTIQSGLKYWRKWGGWF